MKEKIQTLLATTVNQLKDEGLISIVSPVNIKIDRTKDAAHGDYATNIALILSKECNKSPRQVAELITSFLPPCSWLKKVEIAGPGFINFFLHESSLLEIVPHILEAKDQYGSASLGQGTKILLEYVSANPTGPLHVGHGRSAAFGASLANLLSFAGFAVTREYYVNDAGRQMNILAVSVWLRYLHHCGITTPFPANAYKGEYVLTIAEDLAKKHGQAFVFPAEKILVNLPPDEAQGGDKETYIDSLILRAQTLLGLEAFQCIHAFGLHAVLEDIKQDLGEFGVHYDNYYSEASLAQSGAIEEGIKALTARHHTYVQEGALWFKATDFGDEKDRVLMRANGQATYFASDVAYHWDKYNRGFDKVINIFGADHHGYVTRLKAAVNALGHDDKALSILLVQFAILYRGAERVQMSTRSGSFVTLRELRAETGNDAARFFYVLRTPEQHMDFDLELAKSQSNDNPVYYIQYAHARICSVFRQLNARNLSWNREDGLHHTQLLKTPHEIQLLTLLSRFPDVIKEAALAYQPHQVAYYLKELAQALHSYYNAVTLICDEENLKNARFCLLQAVQQVLKNGLKILGVSAPESM